MGNLRDRLRRIHETKKIENEQEKSIKTGDHSDLISLGWKFCGFNVMEREVKMASSFTDIKSLPFGLSILVRDLSFCKLPQIKDFLFFDLETTGLSTGAGTVAFLAAFGKIENSELVITQYLLLDYPGVNDFLENVLARLKTEDAVIVSYNGKSYDSQIIKTMCLMNRIKPPLFRHVDLLHPARRLWKTIIQDCSQGSVESKILGISRENDIPGALAPEIWFDFLKTANTDRLMGICNHNLSDIYGLSVILSVMILIASDLFNTEKICYDTERLSRSVYAYAYRQMITGSYDTPLFLINKAINAAEPGTVLYNKLIRRKIHLEKKINKL